MPLNEQQEAAARALAGPVIVDAGAGSGKTKAMTQRFVNAVDPAGAVPGWVPVAVDSVVAITFTEKSAGELADRIRRALREAGQIDAARHIDGAWLSTIHGFCSRILREKALEAGIDPMFAVADTMVSAELFEQVFEREATDWILESPEAEQLFGERAYGDISQAVERIRRELVKRGMSPDALEPEPAVAPRDAIGAVRALLADAESDLHKCGISGSTMPKWLAACRDLIGRLEEIEQQGLAASQLARALWHLLDEAALKGNCPTAARTLKESHNAERARLMQELAAAASAPSAHALVELTKRVSGGLAAAKRERALLDFDDLQLEACRVLDDPEIAREYRQRFSLMMVDEFQDTDELQLALVSAAAGDNLFTVGDERQSIYRFRGADVGVYRAHRDRYLAAGRTPVRFDVNYRSHAQILGFVNTLFGHAAFFGEDLIALSAGRGESETPRRPEGAPRVEIVLADQDGRGQAGPRTAEATEVARRFAELRDAEGFSPHEMVVLVRKWTHVGVYSRALRDQGFEVIVGGGEFFGLSEVQLCIALLRALANPHDERALGVILASPLGGLSAEGLVRLACGRERGGLWDALHVAGERLTGIDLERAERVHTVIETARTTAGAERLSAVLLRALEGLDYDLTLFSEGAEGRQRYANVLKFCRLADAFEAAGGSGLTGFAEHVEAKVRLGDRESAAALADDGSPAVRIMTMHGSKGLEFPVVAVVGLGAPPVSGGGFVATGRVGDRMVVATKLVTENHKEKLDRSPLFSEMTDSDAREDAEEENRLLYVACTRAEEVLILAGWAQPGKETEGSGDISRVLAALGFDGWDGDVAIGGAAAPVRLRFTRIPAEEDPARTPGQLREPNAGVSPSALARMGDARFSGVPERLSFSATKTFGTCPRRFWLERVLAVGKCGEERPDGYASALDFGSAVHLALAKSALDGAESLAADSLAAIARLHGLSPGQEAELVEIVRAFDRTPFAAVARSMPVCRPETPFLLSIGEGAEAFSLAGAIDLYATDGEQAYLVDYKTGASGDADELRDRYELQARCYALAALRGGAQTVRVVFVRPEVIVDGAMQTVEFGPWGSGDAPAIVETLLAIRRTMLGGTFEAKPDPGSCQGCTGAYDLCDAVHPAARERD